MRTIILGTDWWTDCDDIAAVRIACRAHRKGFWNFAGAVIDACMPYSAASLNAFLMAEGRGEIPVALDRAGTDFTGHLSAYQKNLAERWPHRIASNDGAEEPLPMLKRLLGEAEDGTVELIEIGFPQVWAALIRDPEGMALVERRVRKMWMMAGRFDEGGVGVEHNIANNARSREAAAYLFAHFPKPITFLGWEIGHDVISGGDPENGDDPLVQAFRDHGSPRGRSSWDPMTILLALADDPERAGYSLRRGRVSVDPATGENRMTPDPDGPHVYVVREHPAVWYEAELMRWLR